MEEWDESFRELVGRMDSDHLHFDDENEYREALAFARSNALVGLEKDKNQILYLKAITRLHHTVSFCLLIGTVIGVIWSLRSW